MKSDTSTPPPAPRLVAADEPVPGERSAELRAFLFLTVVMAPVIAFFVITGYGFLVWIYQMFMGPPSA